jgi:hypothetical protein
LKIAKFHTPLLKMRNSTAARRGARTTLPADSSGREQISEQWEFGNSPPICWVGLLVRKYGEKIFKVRFLHEHIAAALRKRGADKSDLSINRSDGLQF